MILPAIVAAEQYPRRALRIQLLCILRRQRRVAAGARPPYTLRAAISLRRKALAIVANSAMSEFARQARFVPPAIN